MFPGNSSKEKIRDLEKQLIDSQRLRSEFEMESEILQNELIFVKNDLEVARKCASNEKDAWQNQEKQYLTEKQELLQKEKHFEEKLKVIEAKLSQSQINLKQKIDLHSSDTQEIKSLSEKIAEENRTIEKLKIKKQYWKEKAKIISIDNQKLNAELIQKERDFEKNQEKCENDLKVLSKLEEENKALYAKIIFLKEAKQVEKKEFEKKLNDLNGQNNSLQKQVETIRDLCKMQSLKRISECNSQVIESNKSVLHLEDSFESVTSVQSQNIPKKKDERVKKIDTNETLDHNVDQENEHQVFILLNRTFNFKLLKLYDNILHKSYNYNIKI